MRKIICRKTLDNRGIFMLEKLHELSARFWNMHFFWNGDLKWVRARYVAFVILVFLFVGGFITAIVKFLSGA